MNESTNNDAGMRERFLKRFMQSPLYSLTLASKAPAALRGVAIPEDPFPAHPEAAAGIMQGHLAIAGTTTPLDEDIWSTDGPSENWFAMAHGFEWLWDLLKRRDPDAAYRAVVMTDKWMDVHMRFSGRAWRADITGRRVVNWVRAAAALAEEAGPSFSDRFRECLYRQLRHLARVAAVEADGAPRLSAFTGWLYGAVAFRTTPDLPRRLLDGLAAELNRQILADGGHASRSPETHLTVLRELLAMRTLLVAAQIEVPGCINNAIDRLTPMLRFFRLGDGAFAQFHGGGESDPAEIEAALKLTDSEGKPPKSAPHTGFERIAAGGMTVLFDVGAPPAANINPNGHAGTLAIEVSADKERLIVNCGARASLDADWRWHTRATAAHSTVTIADTNAVSLLPEGGTAAPAPAIECDRGEVDGSIWLSASHNGYQANFGLSHRRRIFVDSGGRDLRGEDTITGAAEEPFDARFHLHPDVAVSLLRDGRTALLRTKSGAGWHFRVGGGRLEIAESVYLGHPAMAKRSKQLIIHGETAGGAATLKWALQKDA